MSNIKLGSEDVIKVYLGSEEVEVSFELFQDSSSDSGSAEE